VIVGFIFGPEVLGGLLAGVTVSGVLMGIFQNNAGGAWDNAKKSFEKGVEIDGEIYYKKSEPHKASVTGDTVGDPFKDTSGPSMNILIKLMSIVALIIAPHISVGGGHGNTGHGACCSQTEQTVCLEHGAKGCPSDCEHHADGKSCKHDDCKKEGHEGCTHHKGGDDKKACCKKTAESDSTSHEGHHEGGHHHEGGEDETPADTAK